MPTGTMGSAHSSRLPCLSLRVSALTLNLGSHKLVFFSSVAVVVIVLIFIYLTAPDLSCDMWDI